MYTRRENNAINISRDDLSTDRGIVGNKLDLKINGKTCTITWHPKHAEAVASAKTAKKSV
jgi:hypothetical protein